MSYVLKTKPKYLLPMASSFQTLEIALCVRQHVTILVAWTTSELGYPPVIVAKSSVYRWFYFYKISIYRGLGKKPDRSNQQRGQQTTLDVSRPCTWWLNQGHSSADGVVQQVVPGDQQANLVLLYRHSILLQSYWITAYGITFV